MSYNGAYKDLKQKVSKNNQWDLLLGHEKKFGSKTYFLFYNGKPIIRPYSGGITKSDCIGIPAIEELGLGIVETTEVKNVASISRPSSQIYMKQFLPDKMDSLRKLFCCINQCEGLHTLYTYDDIYKRAPYEKIGFTKKIKNPNQEMPSDVEDIIPNKALGLAPFRIIIS